MQASRDSSFSPLSLSVLISVYANEKVDHLDQAIESIWSQQTLKPSQIVLVKDGPLPPALNASIDAWKAKLGDALTVVALPNNTGLGAALNAGLQLCDHELVARMDTDDVSLPERFERQIAFMLNHPEIAAASAQIEEWDDSMQKRIGIRPLPIDADSVAVFAKRRSPLSHPLAIYRKSVILSVGGYPPLRKAQDYALWSLLLCNGYHLANLPDTLLKMRSGHGLFSRRGWAFFKQELVLLRYQREIGFLSHFEFWQNFFLRASLRLSPSVIKRLAYRFAR